MSRAEGRHQEKPHKGARSSSSVFHLRACLEEAIAHHRAGRYVQAEQLYRQILESNPDHAETNHLMGLLAYRTGRLDQAVELLSKATRHDAGQATYWFNFGVVLQKQGQADEAVTAYDRAVGLNPQYPEALSNLGNVLMEQGKLEDAIACYRRALSARPNYAEAHNNLGVALKEQGRLEDAHACYEQALRIAPNHLEALCNLGAVLMDQGNLDRAITVLEQALQIRPDYVKAVYYLAFAFLWQKRFEQALACFRRSAELKQNHGRGIAAQFVYKSRIKHEAEQMQYLFDRRLMKAHDTPYLQALLSMKRRVAETPDPSTRISVSKEELFAIAPSFNRIVHYADCPAIPNGALNPALDVPAIEARYNATQPEVTYIDGLLTQDVLTSLRRFCQESTIWKRDYENGYLGAFLGDGFSCPLLLQIAEELRLKFPGIFHEHRLTQAWAFKYDSERTGLNIHADAAAVNVNFWITPDGANLDPEHGGLIVWDKEAPKEWNFKEYNNTKNEPKVREFLRASGAKAITIPYRANRAVVFNSDLFHETDRFRFKDEYESRRINITLLYGRRLS